MVEEPKTIVGTPAEEREEVGVGVGEEVHMRVVE